MNTFSQHINRKDQKGVDMVRIRSKYFGEYEPDLYILSRSKSRQKSTSRNPIKTQLTGLKTNKQPSHFISSCDNLNRYQPSNFPQSCNPQTKNFDYELKHSTNQQQFSYFTNNSKKLKTEKPAIQRIFEWVQRKYYQKIMNKIFKTPSLRNNDVQNQTQPVIQQQQSHKQLKKPTFNKLMYDLYILHSLKNKDKFSKYPKPKKVGHSSQKNLQKPQISPKKGQQISTMNSIQALDYSSNKKNHNNHKNVSNSYQSEKQITKNYVFSQQNLKDSISFQNTHDFVQNQNQINHQQSFGMKIPNRLAIGLEKKLKKIASIQDQNFAQNMNFIDQRKSQSLLPTVKNYIEENIQKTEQILKKVLEINNQQSSILKIIKNKNLQNQNINYPEKIQNILKNSQSLPFQYQNILKTSNNPLPKKIRPSTNYYQDHFSADINKSPNPRTFEMPIIRSQTEQHFRIIQQNSLALLNNFQSQKQLKSQTQKIAKTQVFGFKSLHPQSKQKELNQPSQYFTQRFGQVKNAFVKNCDIFGVCKTTNKIKDTDRSNYMTEASTMRERETSCNSNQSKNSKIPKVNFKYLSPTVKFDKKIDENKYQNSKLQSLKFKESQKNVTINLNQNKISNNFNIDYISSKKPNIVTQNIDHEKQRSYSLQRFHLNQNRIQQFGFVQQTRRVQERQPSKVQNLNKNIQNQQINIAYYKSQKNLINNKKDLKTNDRNLKNKQSYYFPINKQNNGCSMTQSVGSSFNTTSRNQKRQQKKVLKNKNFLARNDHRYLFPLTNSIEQNRLERTKSMNERIEVTFKKYQ